MFSHLSPIKIHYIYLGHFSLLIDYLFGYLSHSHFSSIPVVEVTMAEVSPLIAGLLGMLGWAAV